MDNEAKKNKNKNTKNQKSKKSNVYKKKNNSNLDWYYNNNFKKNNNKNKANNKNKYKNNNINIKKNSNNLENSTNLNRSNEELIVKNIIDDVIKQNDDTGVSIEVKESVVEKLNNIKKKKNKNKKEKNNKTKAINENQKSFWKKFSLFGKKKKKVLDENSNIEKKPKKWKLFRKKKKLDSGESEVKQKFYTIKSFFKKNNPFRKKNKNKEDKQKNYILIKENNYAKDVEDKKIILDKTISIKKSKNGGNIEVNVNKQNHGKKEIAKDNKKKKKKKLLTDEVIYRRTLYGKKILDYSDSKEIKRRRKRIYLKEALLVALILSIINIVTHYFIQDVSIINITNLKYLNIIITFVISYIFMFIMSFVADWFITELIVKHNRKKQLKEGDSYRNRRVIKGKNKENIRTKKRK